MLSLRSGHKTSDRMHHMTLYALASLQSFVSLGAIVCGILLIIAPDGQYLKLSPGLLAKTPFRDYLIPGLILLVVNGLGQAVAAFSSWRKWPQAGTLGGIFGLGLIIWIFVQVNLIGGGDGLQYVYFSLGIGETVLAFFADRKLRQ